MKGGYRAEKSKHTRKPAKETNTKNCIEIYVSTERKVSPEAALNLARRFVMGLFFGGPSTLGADLIPQSVMESMAQDLGAMKKEPMTFRDGGIASINDITRPVGV